jgi:hypothetical protein
MLLLCFTTLVLSLGFRLLLKVTLAVSFSSPVFSSANKYWSVLSSSLLEPGTEHVGVDISRRMGYSLPIATVPISEDLWACMRGKITQIEILHPLPLNIESAWFLLVIDRIYLLTSNWWWRSFPLLGTISYRLRRCLVFSVLSSGVFGWPMITIRYYG